MSLLFDLPERPSVAVSGEAARFPVNRIFCVGRNYAAHAAEMGFAADKGTPFFFTKTPSAICASGSTIPYPPGTENCHYEMELVAALGKPGFRIAEADTLNHVYGYACGLDMTRRDLQFAMLVDFQPVPVGVAARQDRRLQRLVDRQRCGRASLPVARWSSPAFLLPDN